MWTFAIIVLVLALAVVGVHRFRWPLFNAAIRAQRAKAALTEKVARVDGHEVVYLDGGKGEPLVLLHGFGANKDNWTQIAPFLAPHFRLVIPDLPGFGDSTRDRAARYDADTQLARLKSFIDELELGPVHLGGNSMGGYLAALYAARYPASVKSQWLLAPAGVAGAEPSEYFRYLERGENPLLINNVSDFKRLMDLCFSKRPYVPNVFLRCLCERNMREREFNEKIFGEMFTEPPPALETELAGSDTKTQIVWGDNDRILHPSGASLLATVISGAQSSIMQQMGHCPMLERPRETADLYLKFQGVI
jgi:abhydrolase domain-containing protein 6